MLSNLIPDLVGYILLFLAPYHIEILRHVNKQLAQTIKVLIERKSILNYNKGDFCEDIIKDNQTSELFSWAKRQSLPLPTNIYALIKTHRSWNALYVLRAEQALNPDLVEEVATYIASLYDSRYLYTPRTARWWVYKGHRWFPMEESPSDVLYENARRYYNSAHLASMPKDSLVAWKKLLTNLCQVSFRYKVLKMSTDLMTHHSLTSCHLHDEYICCGNGILDMKTFQLRNGKQDDYVLCGTETEYIESNKIMKLPKSFETNTGRTFLSFCGDALRGRKNKGIFVIQATNYEYVLHLLKATLGDYMETFNPAKGPYLLKRKWAKICIIENDKVPISSRVLISMSHCGMTNTIILCRDVKKVDSLLFTPITFIMHTDVQEPEIDETVLLSRILHAPSFAME